MNIEDFISSSLHLTMRNCVAIVFFIFIIITILQQRRLLTQLFIINENIHDLNVFHVISHRNPCLRIIYGCLCCDIRFHRNT